MSKIPSRCRCCRDAVSDFAKRFDKSLGYVCLECYQFSAYADRAMRKHGIEGSVIDPDRSSNTSTPETP